MDRIPKRINLVGRMSAAKPVVAAANAGACSYVTDVGLSTLSAGVLTIAAHPDYPRTLKIVITDSDRSITGGTVTVFGTDQNGKGISEVVAITGAGSFYTLKAFAKLISATWALVSGTVTDTDDKVAIGAGPALGCPAAPDAVFGDLIKGTFDGGAEAGTFNKTYGTYTPAGTMNGSKAVEATYLFSVPVDVY